MDFAIPFSRKFKYANQNIQWNIKYKPKIQELNNFISLYQNKRINILLEEDPTDKDIQIIQILVQKFPDTKIVLAPMQYNKNLESLLVQNGIPHYYQEIVTDWDKFNGFLTLDITDIIVAEKLAFSAKLLSKKAKKNKKALRVFCNICQSSWEDTPSLKTFFIRPEDLELYEKYFDTIEFFIKDPSVSRLNTLYEIYTKDKKWFGKLKELIIGYEGEEDSRFIIPRFGEQRLNCGKRCVEGRDPICHMCDRIIDLSKTLKDQSIVVSIDKTEKK